MSILVLIFAFLLENIIPFSGKYSVFTRLKQLIASRLSGRLLTSSRLYIELSLMILIPSLLAYWVNSWLNGVASLFSLVFQVIIIWICTGYQQFYRPFNEIRFALARGDLNYANQLFSAWMADAPNAENPADILSDQALRTHMARYVALRVQRQLFGVLFWYAILPGVSGVVLYFMSALISQEWSKRVIKENNNDQAIYLADRVFSLLDYLPTRLSVLMFALFNHFEVVMVKWRLSAGQPQSQRYLSAFDAAVNISNDDSDNTYFQDKDCLSRTYTTLTRASLLWLIIGML